jgi:hypothetical protein
MPLKSFVASKKDKALNSIFICGSYLFEKYAYIFPLLNNVTIE